jgi:hypothetical protein
MKMEDKTREGCTFYSLEKGEVCLYNGELYLKVDGAYKAVLLSHNNISISMNDIGDIVEMRGANVERVNAKIVIEQLD